MEGLIETGHTYKSSKLRIFEVYSLNTRSWKNITSIAPNKLEIGFQLRLVFAVGFLHWISFLEEGGKRCSNVIMGFDGSDETLREITLPENLTKFDPNKLSIEAYRDFSVAVIHIKPNSATLGVRKEYDAAKTWTELCLLPLFSTGTHILTIRKNGELLLEKKNGGGLASYNTESLFIKPFKIREATYSSFAGYFVESLILLDRRKCIDNNLKK